MCTTSESINELSTALAKAQAVMKSASMDGVNPHFSTATRKAKYATLAEIWEACRKPLTDNGLAVIQPVNVTEHGVEVRTRLVHTTGQWIESALTMPVEKKTAQGVGSAITYGRRYGLAAMVGVVADDDDDGNEATANAPKQAEKPAAKKAEPPKSKPDPAKPVDMKAFVDLLLKADTCDGVKKLVHAIDKRDASIEEKQQMYAEALKRYLSLEGPEVGWAKSKIDGLVLGGLLSAAGKADLDAELAKLEVAV